MVINKRKFGEELSQKILTACANRSIVYESMIRKYFASNPSSHLNNPTPEFNQFAEEARDRYLQAVEFEVLDSYDHEAPKQCQEMIHVRKHPELCDLDEASPLKGIMAGTMYALYYYGATGEQASPAYCIALNHKQNDIMNDVINRIAASI